MLFRIIFYSVLFYFIFRIIKFIIKIFSIANQMDKKKVNVNSFEKKYSKDEIEEAEYEEIK